MSLRIRQLLERPAPARGRTGFRLEVDLALPGRGVTVLFGRSGCGKSTLLRCVAGLEPEVRGEVRVGEAVWQDKSGARAPERRRAGVVFQHGALFEHLDVRGNLEFGWKRLSPGQRRIGFDEVIALLGLETLLARRVDFLSGGERQRVALGRALLCSPDLLLLDEPLAALDRDARRQVLPYLEDLPRRFVLPILYVTHFLNEAVRLGDHLVLLEQGRVLRQGELRGMLVDPQSPLTHETDAGAVLDARVVAFDAEDQLTRLSLTGGELLLPEEVGQPGSELRVRIRARDVSLAVVRPAETSILNVLPVALLDLHDRGPGRVLVRLSLGDQILLAAVTRKSAAALELSPGRRLYAQIKSVALL